MMSPVTGLRPQNIKLMYTALFLLGQLHAMGLYVCQNALYWCNVLSLHTVSCKCDPRIALHSSSLRKKKTEALNILVAVTHAYQLVQWWHSPQPTVSGIYVEHKADGLLPMEIQPNPPPPVPQQVCCNGQWCSLVLPVCSMVSRAQQPNDVTAAPDVKSFKDYHCTTTRLCWNDMFPTPPSLQGQCSYRQKLWLCWYGFIHGVALIAHTSITTWWGQSALYWFSGRHLHLPPTTCDPAIRFVPHTNSKLTLPCFKETVLQLMLEREETFLNQMG